MSNNLFTWIDDSTPLVVELETELTKRPAISPESGGEGELDKCLFLESWLKSHGITNLERYDAPDKRAKGGVRPNLIATIPGGIAVGSAVGSEGCLWILSHIDVVPPGEEKLWESNPWTVVRKDNRLFGRGVEDNQQGLVSSVIAAMALNAQGIKPVRTLKLLFAADEEVGSIYGIEWLVKNHPSLFKKDDMVLVPDAGDVNGEFMEIAEKNILWLEFVTRGKQAHGSRPDLGANAFLAGSDLAVRLHFELSAKFSDHDPLFDPDYSTFQPTKKEANVPNINTIPGEDVFCMDMRILPRHTTDSVMTEINRIKTETEKKYGVTVKINTKQLMESIPTSVDAPVVKKLSSAINEVYRVKARPVGIGGGTMAACLRNIGIDCVVWTKTDVSLHQPNEYALIDNILGDAKVMALLALTD
jgi:succinyl-diaminopimelate desuccinylase